MKKVILGLVFLILVLVLWGFVVSAYVGNSPLDMPVDVRVRRVAVWKGMTPVDVSIALGLDSKLFIWGWKNTELNLYAGYIYCLPTGVTSYFDLLQAFRNPCAFQYIRVTFPEGYTLKQMDATLHFYAGTATGAFMRAANDPQVLKRISDFVGRRVSSAEGFMYPDTYYFDGRVNALVEEMLSNFLHKVRGIDWDRAEQRTGLDKYQIIILASIVEKETVKREEAPIIAGVFINRLRRGMKLESCPTVEYALGVHKEVLSYKDLEVDSPYNTYKYYGLPPTPICNPSISSILAVINYQQTDYLYFVADGHGGHLFARTYKEHLENIRRVRP